MRAMKDICFLIGLAIIGMLSILLAVHIFMCSDKGVNWFTAPFFGLNGGLRIMQDIATTEKGGCYVLY